MAPGLRHFADGDDAAIGTGIFLQNDGIGALRNDTAGEDAHRLPRVNGAAERMTGRRTADHAQTRRHHGRIGGAQRVTVHCRNREGRLVEAGNRIVRQNAVERSGERDAFGLGRRNRSDDPGHRFVDGNHRRNRSSTRAWAARASRSAISGASPRERPVR